jgi:two-component sensor histidine kinase
LPESGTLIWILHGKEGSQMSRHGCNAMKIEPCDQKGVGEELLLRELTHRINNELASTIGFVKLTAAQSESEDVKIALAGVIEHIHDFAGVYRALQMPAGNGRVDAAGYLRGLCQSISRAKLQHRGIELTFVESPLQLDAAQCWRLGMIVSELIANASRHAFRDGGGKILVELDGQAPFAECTVTDNGSGAKDITPGQGLRIISSLAADIDGSVEHRAGAMGTCAKLCFPVHGIEAHDAALHQTGRSIRPPASMDADAAMTAPIQDA